MPCKTVSSRGRHWPRAPRAAFARPVLAAILVSALALAGCTHRKAMRLSPAVLYQKAKHDLADYNYNAAIKEYEQLTADFPFSEQAKQAQLDLIYAYYRAGETDSAIDAAHTFIRENPTHPRVDYAYYMEGLVEFPKKPNALEKLFRVDLSKRPPITVRKSFAAFRTVVLQFPHSRYAADAYRRMVYLRDRLASYNVAVARYYMKRGAYVAAARRAKLVIEDYAGAPATRSALAIMILSYERLGLKSLAAQARRVYAANFRGNVAEVAAVTQRPWWHLW
jgi:outer membrane protein assembly factor BamD